ncbi:MarR family winged helix-turn-helix transcriptional regulator [Undibacterium sp.]|uniref:MarR family winged helix-turn-helix transcriptional regulator n=1 Tax=Undibacterium sp. TaxID=1914977 RepID=UPI00374DAE53
MKPDSMLSRQQALGGCPEDFRDLLQQAHQGLLSQLDKELAPHNITAAQIFVVIGIVQGWAHTLTEFSTYMGQDAGAMKRLLDRVESKGIIRRARSRHDRRSVVLELSEQGRQLYPHITDAVAKVNARLLADFSNVEIAQLRFFLLKLVGNAKH